MRMSDWSLDLCSSDRLDRIKGADLQAARAAAAADPSDVEAQFVVADLDLAGGPVAVAFDRLPDLFAVLPDRAEELRVGKEGVRTLGTVWWPSQYNKNKNTESHTQEYMMVE